VTILETPETAVDATDEIRLGEAGAVTDTPLRNVDAAPETPPEEESADARPPVNPISAAAAAFFATAAVGWMIGGTFVGFAPRLVGVLGALIGAGMVGASYKTKNPTILQALALPVAILVGIVMVAPSATGTSVPQLVIDAIKTGGLSQPPAPFDPGWRLLLIIVTCSVAVAASVGAVAANRSRLAVFLPAPIVAFAVLIQPPGKEALSVAPSLGLLVAALAIAFGGELSRDSETGARVESRRLGKAGGLLLVIMAALVGLSQLGFLYPPTPDSTIVPPKRPQTPPPLDNDDVLFTVKQKELSPLRLGVLDVYDGTAWLTPPYDPKRYVEISGARLPAFAPEKRSGFDTPQPAPKKTVSATIKITKVGPAREIPGLTNTVAVSGAPKGTEFDPRSQTIRLPGRGKVGQTYTVTAAALPDAAALAASKTPGAALREFVRVPTAPPAVKELLDAVPPNLNAFERLQFVRTSFYSKITAAGPGNPVDLPPARVQQFLKGSAASPYEITASEVLMARWAGVPARIGYGYYNADAKVDAKGNVGIRPSDGAMWLEAYFEGNGWVPILGKPPKAQAALDDAKKKNDKEVLSNGLITAQLYIPYRQQHLTLLKTIVQFWLVRAALAGGVVFFFWILLPGMVKAFRRLQRRRWAEKIGPRERIAVAYAEIRDRAIDFNIGHPTLTPLEFLDVLEPDDEHTQLAWLVTRGLWGDLRRDLREEDVEAAQTLSRSLFRRLVNAQPFLTRVIAFGSRVSLRDPWSAELPNPYWKNNPIAVFFGRVRAARRRVFSRRMLPLLGRASLLLVVAAFFLSGCVRQPDLSNTAAAVAPLPVIPAKVGDFTFEATPIGDAQFKKYRDVALIQSYGFYVVRKGKLAVATLQTSAFKQGLRSENHKVREGVLSSLGGTPKASNLGGELFYTVTVNELQLIVWFPKNGLTYQLLAATKDLPNPTELFAKLIAVEQGRSEDSVDTHQGAPPLDVRRTAP
jgi:hypothetical protein